MLDPLDLQVGSGLELRLFGPIDVRVDGRPIPRLRSRAGYWLLALLCLRYGREVDRAWIAGTLWPESDASQALHNLRTLLNDLRHALGPEASRLTAPKPRSLLLDLKGAFADVARFDTAMAGNDPDALKGAIDLYCGPLLDGCDEPWVVHERDARQQAYLKALELLSRRALDAGDPQVAIDFLRRAVAVDPFRETAQRGLMEALAAAGNFGAAIQVYRELRVRLREEFNLEPAMETARLYERLAADGRARAGNEGMTARNQGSRLASERGGWNESRDRPPGATSPFRLPRPLTRLIGREEALREVRNSLYASRLVTLTGSGGVGKTRLALEVARMVDADYGHGAWIVDLAPLSDPGLVPHAVAAALGIRDEPGRSVMETLRTVLEARSLLLVLDNCEHLIEVLADLVDRLITECPHLRILATSREALKITGETIYRVPSLVTPSFPRAQSRLNSSEDLAGYSAVQLFVERVTAAVPSFQLDAHNAESVAQICRQLDGIPLALELAAARVRTMPLDQFSRRLSERFRLLKDGSRTALPRHRTLRALIDWSYNLLSDGVNGEGAQVLLRRLSVFAGGWTLEAAERVCAGDKIEEDEVLDLLSSLVEKSLVAFDEADSQGRYHMLETVRQYGRDRLNDHGEGERIASRHRDWFLDLVERREPELNGPNQKSVLHRLEAEHANFLAALDWCRSQPDEATKQMRLTAALGPFWFKRGYWLVAQEWLESALARPDTTESTVTRAKLLGQVSSLLKWRGRHPESRARAREGVDLARRSGDEPTIARALFILAMAHTMYDPGSFEQASTLLEESLTLGRSLEDPSIIALAVRGLGSLAFSRGDYTEARSMIEESLQIDRTYGDLQGIAISLGHLGMIEHNQGNDDRAFALFGESLAIYRDLGDRHSIAYTLDHQGDIAACRRDFAAAEPLFEESESILREMGDLHGIATNLHSQAIIARYRGDADRSLDLCNECLTMFRTQKDMRCTSRVLNSLGKAALAGHNWDAAALSFAEGLTIARDLGAKKTLADNLEGLAAVSRRQGRTASAARLFGAAEVLREVIAAPVLSNDRDAYGNEVAALRAAMGEKSFELIWEEGRTLTLEQAVELALRCTCSEDDPGRSADCLAP